MQPADLTVPITPQDHLTGPMDAPLHLVMYGDYECPYTAMAHELIRELQDALGERLCFVYRNFPLADIHPHALHAATAAEAAGAEGRFWEMHHQLFTHQEALDDASLRSHASAVGVDTARFDTALRAPEHAERVHEDVRGGQASGVRSTPTFFLNGHRHREKFNLQALVQEIFDIPGVDPSNE